MKTPGTVKSWQGFSRLTESVRRNLAKAEALLREKAMTVDELAKALFMSKNSANNYTLYLRGRVPNTKCVLFIEGWKLSDAVREPRWIACYRWITSPTQRDKRPPKPTTLYTHKEMNQRYGINAKRRERDRLRRNPPPALPSDFFKGPTHEHALHVHSPH